MNRFLTVAVASSLAALVAGCSAEPSQAESGPEQDVTAAPGESARVLMDFLTKVDAPSDIPAGNVGVGGRVARIQLTTAQGGIAQFISEGGYVSTADGDKIGNLFDLGGNWQALSEALLADGVKWNTTQGAHGASSSEMLASVECRQVVAPGAQPTCTVKQIGVTADDSKTLMAVLQAANAPSTTPAGMVGSSSRAAKLELDFAQGGIAQFISEGGTVSDLDGNHLADLVTLGQSWTSVRDAVLHGGGVWDAQKLAQGASTAKITARIDCSEPVVPNATPSCTVEADLP